jgi:hypothetical protein
MDELVLLVVLAIIAASYLLQQTKIRYRGALRAAAARRCATRSPSHNLLRHLF